MILVKSQNLCLEHANKLGVSHAQLPIGQYIQNMPSRKVLTVNQVFDIILRWIQLKNWEKAFYEVIVRSVRPLLTDRIIESCDSLAESFSMVSQS